MFYDHKFAGNCLKVLFSLKVLSSYDAYCSGVLRCNIDKNCDNGNYTFGTKINENEN